MSFDLNISSKNLSNVQASSKSQDGGAGNTGYFARNEEENEFNFRTKDYENDCFEKKAIIETKEELTLLIVFLRFIEKILNKINCFFKNKS